MTPLRSFRPRFLGNGLMQRRPNQLKPKRGDKGRDKGSQRACKDISNAFDSDADDREDLEGGIGRPWGSDVQNLLSVFR